MFLPAAPVAGRSPTRRPCRPLCASSSLRCHQEHHLRRLSPAQPAVIVLARAAGRPPAQPLRHFFFGPWACHGALRLRDEGLVPPTRSHGIKMARASCEDRTFSGALVAMLPVCRCSPSLSMLIVPNPAAFTLCVRVCTHASSWSAAPCLSACIRCAAGNHHDACGVTGVVPKVLHARPKECTGPRGRRVPADTIRHDTATRHVPLTCFVGSVTNEYIHTQAAYTHLTNTHTHTPLGPPTTTQKLLAITAATAGVGRRKEAGRARQVGRGGAATKAA
jgi:hypothetical protein